jgi:hypothetical protein
MVRMHCKSPFLQYSLTKCHIITLREMQKIKMSTNTPNQNKYNTKNTLASRPNRLKKQKKKDLADPCWPWVWWVRRVRQPIGLGLAGHDPLQPDSTRRDVLKSASKLDTNASKLIANTSKSVANASKYVFGFKYKI